MLVRIIASVGLAATLIGCGASREAGYDRQIEAVSGDEKAFIEKADALWEKRGDKASLEEAIALYEKAAAVNPQNLDTLARIAHAYYFLADAHYQNNTEKQIEIYDQGAAAGERALILSPEFKASEDKYSAETLAAMDKKFVPALYWTASSLGKWARLKGFITLLKVKDRVKGVVQAVTDKDPAYFHHAPDRYWGVYYAVAPSFAGGDPAKSKEKFEASIAASPGYLGTKVLYADTYATKVQDVNLYIAQLKEVLAGDLEGIKGLRPEQESEKRKARALLDRETIEDRFSEIDEAALDALEKELAAMPVDAPAAQTDEPQGATEATGATEAPSADPSAAAATSTTDGSGNE